MLKIRFKGFNIPNSFEGGFTLLEIMIALAIIGIALTTIIYTVNYQAGVSYDNTVSTQMYMLAKEKMAEMEISPQNSAGDLPGTGFKFANTAEPVANTDIIELKTVVTKRDKEVALSELITKKAK